MNHIITFIFIISLSICQFPLLDSLFRNPCDQTFPSFQPQNPLWTNQQFQQPQQYMQQDPQPVIYSPNPSDLSQSQQPLNCLYLFILL